MGKKTTPILFFIAGALIGGNWDEIEKYLKPYLKKMGINSSEAYSVLITFFAQQKEKLSDLMAELKASKEEPEGEKGGDYQKKKIRKRKKVKTQKTKIAKKKTV